MSEKPEDISLISCKHGKLPWSIVCIHLMEDPTLDWIPIPQEKDDLNDWVCPECDRNWNDNIEKHNIDDLRPVCIKCVDEIRCVFDHNYEKEDN